MLLMFSPAQFLDAQNLIDDLGRSEIATPAVETARAEFATVGAADLRRDAERPAIGSFAIQRGRRRDEHGLDQRAVAEAKEKLARRVIGAEHADRLQVIEMKLRGELLAQRRRQIRHLLEAPRAFPVDPFRDLFRAERRLAKCGKVRPQFVERERFDWRAAGRHQIEHSPQSSETPDDPITCGRGGRD